MKRTFQPSNIKRKRKHGFRSRMSTVAGRAVLSARRAKGRAVLCAQFFVVNNSIYLKVSSNTLRSFRHANKIVQKNSTLLYFNNNLDQSRIAIQVTKKAVKLAVIRNRIRRMIRESFRDCLGELGSLDILLLISSKIYSEKYEISDILMQEWKLSIKSLQQSQI